MSPLKCSQRGTDKVQVSGTELLRLTTRDTATSTTDVSVYLFPILRVWQIACTVTHCEVHNRNDLGTMQHFDPSIAREDENTGPYRQEPVLPAPFPQLLVAELSPTKSCPRKPRVGEPYLAVDGHLRLRSAPRFRQRPGTGQIPRSVSMAIAGATTKMSFLPVRRSWRGHQLRRRRTVGERMGGIATRTLYVARGYTGLRESA